MIRLADGLRLPVDVATQTMLVVGKRGSGKTTTAVVCAEQLHAAKVPIVVIDPVDKWWGIKASKDGKGPGLDVYVFGGGHADLPLEHGAGALMADTAIDHRISMVLSCKHFTVGQRAKFVTDFSRRLLARNREPICVILEEAHEVAPQQPSRREKGDEGDEAQMLGAVNRLWKLGRGDGIGGIAVTQRPASLSKNVTTQAEILVVHRILGPQDRDAVKAWIQYHGESDQILGELSGLRTGEAFVWSPDFPEGRPIGLVRVKIDDRTTFDSSATPKVGKTRIEPRALAPVDLEILRERMAATIQRAEADDPKLLKARITKLEHELAHARARGPAEGPTNYLDQVKAAEKAMKVMDRSFRDLVENENKLRAGSIREVTRIRDAIVLSCDSLEKVLSWMKEPLPEVAEFRDMKVSLSMPPNMAEMRTRPRVLPPLPVTTGDDNLTGTQRRILSALRELENIGIPSAPRVQVALFSGYTNIHSKSFKNSMSELSTLGYVRYPDAGRVELTNEGAVMAPPSDKPTTTRDLHDRVRQLLTPILWRILEPLLSVSRPTMSRTELAALTGYTNVMSKSFKNSLSRLSSLGLVTYPSTGTVRAADILFIA